MAGKPFLERFVKGFLAYLVFTYNFFRLGFMHFSFCRLIITGLTLREEWDGETRNEEFSEDIRQYDASSHLIRLNKVLITNVINGMQGRRLPM